MSNPAPPTARRELLPEQLRRRCDPAAFPFATTAEAPPLSGLIGQQRATEALAFGLALRRPGFNVYVSGPSGSGKHTAVSSFLEAAAGSRPAPDDWCYVHNFKEPARPRVLRLPPGEGQKLRAGLRQLVLAARRDIPHAFESEEYIARREAILGTLQRRREQGMAQLATRAQAAGFVLQPAPVGVAIIPVMGNQPLTEDQVATLRPEMRELIEKRREEIDVEIRAFFKQMRAAERETREQLEQQDREVALHAAGGVVDDLAEHYEGRPEIVAFLGEVREALLADIALFRGHPLPSDGALPEPAPGTENEHALHERAFRKYEVNVIVDNNGRSGAPVIVETNPTYPNLIGRIEREALLGALVTDFTLVGGGALHRANGGYLVVRAVDVLRAPLAWDALKRALRAGAAEIEDVSDALGITGTRGLRPDPIPLDVKVFLTGEPDLYQLLYALDPDFRELFRVRADFAPDMERTPAHEAAYGSFVGTLCGPGCLPMDRTGVARLVEESSRMVEDQRRLSARFGLIAGLVQEAEQEALTDGAPAVTGEHVRRAVEQRRNRAGLIPERLQELLARGVLLARPEGEAAGEVLGLAVADLGDAAFGRPERITATVAAGKDGVIDIERQVELGGPIHTKGMLILGGYLADTFGGDEPLALSARLVFEQSYSAVDGDSASLAETLALLSRLAGAPLRREIAVTGSINQRGEVQAVGGVNEKIEGFFDACLAVGGGALSGGQGVVLPAANAQHLMLRDDVVQAAADGKFRVWAVATVDAALELLSGLPAAEIHARVRARLATLAEAVRRGGDAGGNGQRATGNGGAGSQPP